MAQKILGPPSGDDGGVWEVGEEMAKRAIAEDPDLETAFATVISQCFPEVRRLQLECLTCDKGWEGDLTPSAAQEISAVFYERHPAPTHEVVIHYPNPRREETAVNPSLKPITQEEDQKP
jgi:hypothetical protein